MKGGLILCQWYKAVIILIENCSVINLCYINKHNYHLNRELPSHNLARPVMSVTSFHSKKSVLFQRYRVKELVLLTQFFRPPVVFKYELFESQRSKNPAKSALKSSVKVNVQCLILPCYYHHHYYHSVIYC